MKIPALKQWEQWWTREAPPHILALFRIVFGSFLLLYWGLKLPHVTMLFSEEGIVLPLFDAGFLGLFFAPPNSEVAWVLYSVHMGALLLLTVGLLSRVGAAIAFILSAYYWFLSLHLFGTSFDRLFLFTLLVLACSGSDRTFSVSMWWKHGSFFAWEAASILPQRLLAAQITATYLGVGWQKLWLPDWQSGEVLAYGFIGRWATPPAYALARMNFPLEVYDWAVTAIKGFEMLLPFGLWSERFRWWFFLGGALFHIGIAVLLAIWWFLVLIPAYILFYEPEEVLKVMSIAIPAQYGNIRDHGGTARHPFSDREDRSADPGPSGAACVPLAEPRRGG